MIQIENLSYSYPNADKKAISGISTRIGNGITAIMGKNGSGKTTLLKVIAGLIEPDEGAIDTGDEKYAGFVPENPEEGFFENTVREEVEFFPKNLDLDFEKKAEKSLEKLNITHLAERSPFTLSAGEMKKVSIASVLSGVQKTMTLDEPVKSLNKEGETKIGTMLEKLKGSTTIILATHNSNFAYEFADEVIILENGKMLKEGDARSVLSNRKLCEKAGLEVPGIVKWAEKRGITPPGSFEKALEIFSGDGSD